MSTSHTMSVVSAPICALVSGAPNFLEWLHRK
jgi:hypothetical protein